MTSDKEEVKLFMELKTLEERGVGIWMEGHASDSKKVMETMSVNEDSEKELQNNSYPGRGIIIGKSPNGKYAVTAYFIMGRSENSRNRVFVTEGESN